MKKIFLLAFACAALASCDDFLQRDPLDFGNETSYFKTEADLKNSCNNFYTFLPEYGQEAGGIYKEDGKSDNMFTGTQSMFYKGEKLIPDVKGSAWETGFKHLREVNFFIASTEGKVMNPNGTRNWDAITGSPENSRHYLGEGYFFRAYEHYKLLTQYGDIPYLTSMLPDDAPSLSEADKRLPRNIVARKIIADLDTAANLLKETVSQDGRVLRATAYAMKSRVALFEATWEKYHAATCFVPGNKKWPGQAYAPKGYSYDAATEINYFLDQCIAASEQAIAGHDLDADYQAMFVNSGEIGSNDEVVLARHYKKGVLSTSWSYYLKGGAGAGATRALVNTYLMKNGLPIYADGSGYHGDETSYEELLDRDPRLSTSIRPAGKVYDADGNELCNYVPNLTGTGSEKSTTGYELEKWCSKDDAMREHYGCTTAMVLLRTGECMLNYLEAYYLRNGNLGGQCAQYWTALRQRAGMDTDFQKTIAATDLTQENDLAVYSKGQMVDKTLYNIRRERRCELFAEGTRLDDLKRWRALDSMVEYHVEGFNLWDKMYLDQDQSKLNGTVSVAGVGKYVRPNQVNPTNKAYAGYTFPKPHYLEPIPASQFLLSGGATGQSTIYQNPGWNTTGGTADYSYDCD